MRDLTSGLIFGDLQFSPPVRPMIILLEPGKFTLLLIGYGNHPVRINESFFSGCGSRAI
jgi:hypothetical protein